MKKVLARHVIAFWDKYPAALIVAIIMLTSFFANGQVILKPNNSYGLEVNRLVVDSTLYYPTGCGVPSGTPSLFSVGFGAGQTKRMSAFYYDSCGHKLWIFDPSSSSWSGFSSGVIDTTSLSNRINLRVQYADTNLMLTPYARMATTVANGGGTPSFREDVAANRPAAGNVGVLFLATDTKLLYRDNGSTWDLIGSGGGGGGVTTASGDATGTASGSNLPLVISNNVVTNAKSAQMAAGTVKSNITGSTANASDNTLAAFEAALANFGASLAGLAPASGGGTTNYLRADGTWAVPPGTGGVTFANPTATISGTAVNGTATTAMRSDAAPAIATNAVTNTLAAQMPANTVKSNITGSTANAADNSLSAFAAALPQTQVYAARGTSATTIAGVPAFVLGHIPGQPSLDSTIYETLSGTQDWIFDSVGTHLYFKDVANATPGAGDSVMYRHSSGQAFMAPAPSGGSGVGTATAGQRLMADAAGGGTVVGQNEVLHSPVRLATVVALSPANTYNNGTAGVGATLTGNSNAALSVDGVAVALNDRILVKNEANPINNGIYNVTQTGSGSAPYILTRGSFSAIPGNMAAMSAVGVQAGATQTNQVFYQTTTGPITIGTTSLVYAREPLPQSGPGAGSCVQCSASFDAQGRVVTYGNGSTGGVSLTQTPNGDSLGANGNNTIRVQEIANSYNNECYWCDRTLSLVKSKFAQIRNNYSIPSDSAKLTICIGPAFHSFGDKFEIWQKNLVDVLLPKFPFAGPGFFNGDMTNYNFTCGVGWTNRSLGTLPRGRGIDGKELVSTSSDITIQSATQTSSYNQYQDIKIYTYDTVGAGTFVVKDAATTVATINCASGSGFTVTPIHLATYGKHNLTLHETVAGTTHCYFLGIYLYTSNIPGIIVNKMACGSTDITNWTAMDPNLMIQELTDINPDWVLMDCGVNNQAHDIDTLVARAGYDTLVGRIRVAAPNAGITIMKGTDYSFLRYTTPNYSRRIYNRGVDYIVRKDSISSFDDDLIMGPFPRSLTIQTINAGDSLHPISQTGYTFVTNLLKNVGGFFNDAGTQKPNYMDYTSDSGSITSNAALKAYNYQTALNVSNYNAGWWEWKTSTGGSLRIDPTPGSGQVNFTGPSGAFNFSGANVQTNGIFNSTSTGTCLANGKFAVGTGGSLGRILDVHMTTGASNAQITSDASTGFSDLILKNNTGTGAEIILPGSAAGIGAPYVNGTFQIFGEQGAMYLWNQTNNPLIFGVNNAEKARFDATGSLLLGTSTNAASSLLTMSSTTQGLLFPRMTLAQATAISSPATSLHFCLTDSSGKLALWNGSKIVTYATTDQLGGGSTNIYNTDGTLTATRTLSGASNALNLGATGSKVTSLSVNASGSTVFNSGTTYAVDAFSSDAAHTMAVNTVFLELNDASLTANRTITLPASGFPIVNGAEITIINEGNNASFNYVFSASVTDNQTGSGITTIAHRTTYRLFFDSGLGWRIISKY